MDHDFYSLDKAATLLYCEIPDLLEWGAKGKIDLCIWYEGRHHSPYDDSLSVIRKLIAISDGDIRRIYLGYTGSPQLYAIDPKAVSVVTIKHPTQQMEGQLTLKLETYPTAASLFLMPETFDTLKAKLLKSSTESVSPCLDENHQFHAKELKIAIEAWTALFEKKEIGDPIGKIKSKPGGASTMIKKWLGKKYPGQSDSAYERIATVINPFKQGGAPRRTE